MNFNESSAPYLVIVMGVSGSGKTSLAKSLAKSYGVDFMEADDFHSNEAKEHMASGKALTDEMREPWIKRMIHALTLGYGKNRSYILSYSGLKAAHRQRFRDLPFSPKIVFIMLDGEKNLIETRMKKRNDHFMPTQLLDSQFDALEYPKNESDILIVSIDQPLSSLLKSSREKLENYKI